MNQDRWSREDLLWILGALSVGFSAAVLVFSHMPGALLYLAAAGIGALVILGIGKRVTLYLAAEAPAERCEAIFRRFLLLQLAFILTMWALVGMMIGWFAALTSTAIRIMA